MSAFLLALLPSLSAAQGFSNCITPSSTDRPNSSATVIVPETAEVKLPDGVPLEAGDEVALFTTDDVCAGLATVESGSETTITAYGPADPNVPSTRAGFDVGERMLFRVFDSSASETYVVNDLVTYRTCGSETQLCNDDGTYASSTFSTVTTLGDDTLLPVELTGFAAERDGGRALLTWTTATETNNAGFEVQRRLEDAQAFERIGFVRGAGTTTEAQRYRFRTGALPSGTHTFRLRQVDVDGTASFSPVVTVRVEMEQAYTLSEVAPNPVQANGQLTLRLRTSQDVTARVYNVLGQHVTTLHDGPLPPNTDHRLRLDGSRLPSGVYFIRVEAETFSTTRRAIVVR